MQLRLSCLVLVILGVSAKIDWCRICADAGEIQYQEDCADSVRGNTFSALADKIKLTDEGSLQEACKNAILERNKQARADDTVIWKTECAVDLTRFCSEVTGEDETNLRCLGSNQNEISKPCHSAIVLLQRVMRQQANRGPPPEQRRPMPPRKQVPQQPRASGFAARIRSASQPDDCLSYPDPTTTGKKMPCDASDPAQAFSIVKTPMGYAVAISQTNACLRHKGNLIPCRLTAMLTYFSLTRRADHTVTIQDLHSEYCLGGSGTNFTENCETGKDIGWYIEPTFTKFVLAEPEPEEPEKEEEVFLVQPKPAPKQPAGKGKGRRGKGGKGKGKLNKNKNNKPRRNRLTKIQEANQQEEPAIDTNEPGDN